MGCIRIYGYTPIFLLVCKIVVENICKVLDFCNFASPLLNYSNKCGVCEVRFPYTGFRQMLFKDSLYNVPAETDKYLSAHYGSTFMQPDPNFSESEASNIKYYSLEEKEGIAFIYRNI